MMTILYLALFLAAILILGAGSFYTACFIVKLWTGCTMEQAGRKIHNRINGKVVYSFPTDAGFAEEVWENIRSIIGEVRFQELWKLSNTKIDRPLLCFGVKRCLPYIAISVYCNDNNEKCVIRNVVKNIVELYLNLYGYGIQTLTNWSFRYDLAMPVLYIYYFRNETEKRTFDKLLEYIQKKTKDKNNDIHDDTEGDDLNNE